MTFMSYLYNLTGCLERHILEHFRSSSVKRIDLSATFSAADGLNESRSSVVLDSKSQTDYLDLPDAS